MSRKRCHRRPVPVRQVPIMFSFSSAAKVESMIQARAVVQAVLDHTATPEDLQVLTRIAMYSNAMCEHLIKSGSVESDGLADVAEATSAGVIAVSEIIERLGRTGKVGTAGPEREPLLGLVDAYEALFSAATRRETAAVFAQLPGATP